MTRDIALVDQMTYEELEAAETLIRRNLQTIGMALKIIRDRRGYLTAGFGTFEEYCQKKWSISRARAYQLIDAAGVVGAVSTIVDIPLNEAQARELAPIVKEHGPEAAAQVLDEVRREGKVTAAKIRNKVREKSSPTDSVDPSLTWDVENEKRINEAEQLVVQARAEIIRRLGVPKDEESHRWIAFFRVCTAAAADPIYVLIARRILNTSPALFDRLALGEVSMIKAMQTLAKQFPWAAPLDSETAEAAA